MDHAKLFSPVTRAQWEAKATEELKGRPLASLTRTTADGIEVAPLYLRDAGPPGPRQLQANSWLSVQEYRHADPKAANVAARRDLELGADGVWFVLDSELRSGREPGTPPDGLVCDAFEQLDALLDGIDPTRTPVFFDAGVLAPVWADALEEWLDTHGDDEGEAMTVELGLGPSPNRGGVIYDPIATLVRTGSLEHDFEGALARLSDTILGMRTGLLGVSTLGYHDAGASDAQELALALCTCAELLRRGAGLGLEIADLASAMVWTLPIAGRPFEAIAKLRAARVLWAKFTCAAGYRDANLWIHATSSRRTWTRHGPWVNLLRGTVGSFAAAAGGANSIATAAFDGLCGPEADAVDGLGLGSELGRRLALNTQLILREEARLDRVIDPGGGSWYIESLTDALARTAWQRFRELERSGGLVANLCSGVIHDSLAASAERLRDHVATRKQPITGVSTYPVLDEQPTPTQSANAVAGDRQLSPDQARLSPVLDPAEIPKLPRLRLAAPFERLRDASASGTRPCIYVCNLGPLAGYQARADFAANSLLAGGIQIVASEGLATDDHERLLAQASAGMRASGCSIALICGQDRDYPPLIAPLLVTLRAAGAQRVWIAGRPPRDNDPSWGLDPELPPRYLFVGCDLLDELEHALRELGVIPPAPAEDA